eukprot:6177019-Pleurochrysis_carterae.AAC.1
MACGPCSLCQLVSDDYCERVRQSVATLIWVKDLLHNGPDAVSLSVKAVIIEPTNNQLEKPLPSTPWVVAS